MFASNKTGPFCLLLLDYPVFTLSYLTSFHLLAAKFSSLISPKKIFSLVFLLNWAGFSFIFLKTTVFRFLRPNYALVGLFASRAHFREMTLLLLFSPISLQTTFFIATFCMLYSISRVKYKSPE